MDKKKVVIASDHAGWELKTHIMEHFSAIEFIDLGPYNDRPVNYASYAYRAAEYIIKKQADYAILICGSGIGMSIAANRYPEIRAALCYNEEVAKLAREHNDANILVLGARFIEKKVAYQAVSQFLNSDFAGGRHIERCMELGNPPAINDK